MGCDTIRVLIVEDHSVVLWGLRNMIESEAPAMSVVGSARNRYEAVTMVRATRPDVILLDLNLGDESGLDFLPQLRTETGARVLVLTGIRDEETHRRSLQRGASGVVCKDEPAEVVLKAVRKIYEGEVWYDRRIAYGVLKDLIQQSQQSDNAETERVAALTPKEREIITVIASEENSTNKQVALRLRISENTLRNHLASIYDKLDVSNRLELLKFALRQGLA
jgi:two-component system nitrate/nitrite response regulator NarL